MEPFVGWFQCFICYLISMFDGGFVCFGRWLNCGRCLLVFGPLDL